MFNTARFNLQRFNIQSQTEVDAPIMGLLKETLNCAIDYGENVIHLHSGDWPTLNRDTYDMLISMDQTAPFEVTMIYEERYL